ncbi:MAG: (Fe-S)-binding protein [Gaiellales bacterium]
MTATRETFVHVSTLGKVVWYTLVALSTAVFLTGVVVLVRKYRRGRRDPEFDGIRRRLLHTLRVVASHAWIRRRDPVSGAAHLLVFYGFLILLAGTTILAVQDDVLGPLGVRFWRGAFYEGYSLTLDAGGLALLAGLGVLAVRRGLVRPALLDYRRNGALEGVRQRYVVGDWLFLTLLGFLVITGFALEALRITGGEPSFERWSPVGWSIAHGLAGAGMSSATASSVHHVLWWAHGVVALAFVASIPFTKAVHMLTGPAGVAARSPDAGRRLVPIPQDTEPDRVGYGTIADLSWRHLADLDACTKCGRCHAACPATASGYPLSPRDLVLDLRELAEGSLGIRAHLGVAPLHDADQPIVGTAVSPETVWSCMHCMACVEICPVGIEHVPIINGLRRRLVEQGELEPMLQSTLEMVHAQGNSHGESRRRRGRWTRDLDLEVKDIRTQPAEWLWFVGDQASFDPRNQRVSQALARILTEAGVDFGILYDGERTAGNDIRRVGEEGLFASLAEHNVSVIADCEFDRILTTDPHTLNTLRNEYPDFGGCWQVVHHSELLAQLMADGRIAPRVPLARRVTYHDPCHLGRYNGVYEPPRRVLEGLGLELVEMPRNRDNSFCCGAGGGRIWMPDLRGEGCPRPSEARIAEAVALGAIDHFVVACPKDVTMYEDAIKTSGNEGAITLREITELVAEALGPAPD